MKKTLGLLFVTAMGVGAIYLASCAKQPGPLSPNTNVVGTGSNFSAVYPKASGFAFSISIPLTSTAKVSFDQDMDPASFNSSTVLLYTLDSGGSTETLFTAYTMQYFAPARQLIFTPTSAWTNNVHYHLVLTTGVRSLNGKQLDSNGNNIPEADAFDAYHSGFDLGTPVPTQGYYGSRYITLVAVSSVGGSGNAWSLLGTGITEGAPGSGLVGNSNYTNVTLTVRFSIEPAATPVPTADPAFSLDASSVSSNILITDYATGAAITPVTPISVTSTAFTNDTATIVLSIPPASKYKLQIRGGLNGIRANAASARWSWNGNSYFFNGNNANSAEAVDNSRIGVIRSDAAAAIPDVQCSSAAYVSSPKSIEVAVSVPTGNGTLDTSTVNSTNVRIFKYAASGPETPLTPASIAVDNSTAPNPKIIIYLPQTLCFPGPDPLTVRVVVQNIKASDGSGLDQNLDNITGTDLDVYWPAVSGVANTQ